jgi:hypothetical protein
MKKPKLKKDSWMALRLPAWEHDKFNQATALKGTTMSQAIRKFINGYIDRHLRKEG